MTYPTVTPTSLANTCHRYVETSDMREGETLREWRGRQSSSKKLAETRRNRLAFILNTRKAS